MDRPDWKDWILEKNKKFQEEELSKSDSLELSKGSKNKETLVGGKGDRKDDSQFDAEEIKMGHKVEREHSKDNEVVGEIVRDHLSEDPRYYSKLKAAKLADELEKAKVYGMDGGVVADTPSDLWPTPKTTMAVSDRGNGVGEIIRPEMYGVGYGGGGGAERARSHDVGVHSVQVESDDPSYSTHVIYAKDSNGQDRHIATAHMSNPAMHADNPHEYIEHADNSVSAKRAAKEHVANLRARQSRSSTPPSPATSPTA